MAEVTREKVPGPLAEVLAGRDQSTLPEHTFLRYQHIGLTPAIDKNRRFDLHRDGSLHGAVNAASTPVAGERFNVELSVEPTTVLSDDQLRAVRAELDAVGFFDAPMYVAEEGVRDGAATIVTAMGDDGVHEVWYVNVDNALTNLLWSLLDDPGSGDDDPAQILADLERIRDEQA